MKRSRAVEALTNAADDSQEIRWHNLPHTWQTCCLNPSSSHPCSPACSKMPFTSLSQTQKSTRGRAVSGAICGVPHKSTSNSWEKQVRKAKITSYTSNSWKTFKLLYPAASEARNTTSHHPEKQHNCGLPAHSWGQATHMCPGCSCCQENSGKLQRTIGQCQLQKPPLLPAVPQGSKGTPRFSTPQQVTASHALQIRLLILTTRKSHANGS